MNTGSCNQTSAAGMKPYKHTTLSYQSGCQWITLSDTHTVFTKTRCGGKKREQSKRKGKKESSREGWKHVRMGGHKRVERLQKSHSF